jgi:ribonuclease BN (tRNA processing enzyme)
MEINVLGTGEAFDEELHNSSFLININNKNILVDCGFRTPYELWKTKYKDDIDYIYITHFHADHTFGIPALITRMFEEKREKKLTIISQRGIKEYFTTMMNIAYNNILTKLLFEIDFIEAEKNCIIDDISLTFASTSHSIKNLAICIKYQNKCICISGDGAPTKELITMYLTNKPDLIIQETFSLNKNSNVHCSLEEIYKMHEEENIQTKFAITHISRNEKPTMYKQNLKKYCFFLKENEIITI